MVRIGSWLLGLVIPSLLVAAEPPARVLDLSSWMLTLPVEGDRAGTPGEIKQPRLDSFVEPRYFFVNEQADGVVFRAHCGGITTKGSGFPRSELREMTEGGKVRAGWNTEANEQRTMTMQVARKGCYFKAGCYAQSNPDKGDDPQAYAEVVIYRLRVSERD